MTPAECAELLNKIADNTQLRTDKIALRDDHIYQAAALTTEIQQLTTTIMQDQMQYNAGCTMSPPPPPPGP